VGELVVAIQQRLEGPDPHSVISSVSRMVLRSSFETLVDREHGFVGGLATAWEPVSGGCRWRFRLRDGIRFHDGRPLDSRAVAEACERFQSTADNIMAGALSEVTSVEMPADDEIVFVTERPSPALPLAFGRVPIALSTASGGVVGTGPFRLGPIGAIDNDVVFERFDGYWGGPAPSSQVRWTTIQDAGARFEAVRSGEAHIAGALHPHVLSDDREAVRIVTHRNMLSTGIMLNLKVDGLGDTRVRQALNIGLDRDALIAEVFNGAAAALPSPIGPDYFGFSSEVPLYPYDPERARQLLSEAGHEQITFQLSVPAGRYATGGAAAAFIAESLAEVGVSIELRELQWGPFVDGIMEKRHEAFYMQVSTMASERLLANEFSSRQRGVGWHFYENEAVDELVEAANRELDEERRAELIRRAAAELHNDPPWIFLYNEYDIYALAPEVDGWQPLANGFIDVSRARIASSN
jgi:ABC-type transport system substrate-binding protein